MSHLSGSQSLDAVLSGNRPGHKHTLKTSKIDSKSPSEPVDCCDSGLPVFGFDLGLVSNNDSAPDLWSHSGTAFQ